LKELASGIPFQYKVLEVGFGDEPYMMTDGAATGATAGENGVTGMVRFPALTGAV